MYLDKKIQINNTISNIECYTNDNTFYTHTVYFKLEDEKYEITINANNNNPIRIANCKKTNFNSSEIFNHIIENDQVFEA